MPPTETTAPPVETVNLLFPPLSISIPPSAFSSPVAFRVPSFKPLKTVGSKSELVPSLPAGTFANLKIRSVASKMRI